MAENGILAGIKVLDVGSFVFGPAAATVMSDFGADVIKIEPPATGDPYRYLAQMPPLPACDENYCWLLTARNKRSVALDLKQAEAREILLDLAHQADVFLTNYPVPVLRSLRISYEDVAGANDQLIYAHATGYGHTGPESDKPGYDATAWWARSGLQDVVRPRDGEPGFSAPGMGDHPGAMSMFGAIMLALYRRERTGRGGQVSSSLLANGAWSNSIYMQAMLCGSEPFRNVDAEQPANAVVNQYRTKDGRYLLLAMVQEDKLWAPFCRAIERPDLAEDARFATKPDRRAHAVELSAILRPLFASHDFVEWRKRLDEQGITFAHVARLEELPDDPQFHAAGIFAEMPDGNGGTQRTITSPIEVKGETKVTPRRPPEIGEHTDDILRALGYESARIDTLRASGAIR